MARRLRLQFPGARYHLINRGNLQHDIFATDGAKRAFIVALGQTVRRFAWEIDAFIVMRNHYHLAVQTPEPNLVEGMHWLQSTFATRLTRFHRQHGHVFQGRYKALLVESPTALARVCDYIHLNPVRAGMLQAKRVGDYRWSSLWHRLNPPSLPWLREAGSPLSTDQPPEPTAWGAYCAYLAEIVANPHDERVVRGSLSRGWAIGTSGWRRALAREYEHLALAPEMSTSEIAELKSLRWQRALAAALTESGRSLRDAETSAKGAPWKVALATQLRATVAPPYRWLAEQLRMGHPGAVRGLVSRQNQQSAD